MFKETIFKSIPSTDVYFFCSHIKETNQKFLQDAR